MTMSKQLRQVTAYEAWAIFADYEEAPSTGDLLIVATEELAKELTELFNKNPREQLHLAHAEGHDYSKVFLYRMVLVASQDGVSWTREDALKSINATEEDFS